MIFCYSIMRRTVMPGGMSLLRRSMLKYVRQNHVSIPKQVGNMTGAMFRYVSQDGIHFVRDVLRLKLVEVRRQEVVMKLKLRPAFWLKEALTGDVAQTHSGLLVAAIDHVGGACAMTVLPRPGLMLSTVNLQVDYCNALIPADQGVICVAKVVADDEKLIRVDIICWNYSKTKQIAMGRAMYNIYENKPGIRKLHAAFQWILGNSYLMTNLLVGRFSRDLMRKHEMVHRLKQYRNPNAFTEHQFNVIPASACEAVAIYFAERTDTRIRDVLGTRVCSIAAGAISLTQPYKPIFTGNFVTPCLHGGVTAALLEHCAQSCVLTLPTCHAVKVKTENIRIDYLGPAPCFTATLAEAKVVSECDNYVRVDLICWNHDKSVKIALGMVELSRIYAS